MLQVLKSGTSAINMNKTLLTIFIIFAILLLTTIMFVNVKQDQLPATQHAQKSDFVTSVGQKLFVSGKQFRSIGVNRYNLLTRSVNGNTVGCANPFSEAEIDTMFSQLHSMGVTSIRFWLFQSFTNSGDDMSRFDYVLATATKYNIKVIPVLENHWKDCTENGDKNSDWYTSGYKAPYGAYQLSLKEYIAKVVPKYKDNPTILTWEIMNEATSTDYQSLHNFAQDISGYIKSLDSNHLVSLSLNEARESTADIERLVAIKTIDVLDYHDYENETNPLPNTLRDSLEIAKKNNKPLFVGESGIKETLINRVDLFDAKIHAFFQNGGAIYLLWSYGDSYITNDGFNFTFEGPVTKLVKQVADEIK
jgi:endo-1,4-beta-mannosidase